MAVKSAYGTPEELRSIVDELAQLVTIEATKQGNLFSEEKKQEQVIEWEPNLS